MRKYYSVLIIMAAVIAFTIGCSDKSTLKGLNSISISENVQTMDGKEYEKRFLYSITLQNQTDSDIEIEWVEPVFQGNILKMMENKDLRQSVPNKFSRNKELKIENSFQFTIQKNNNYQMGDNISGVNIKLKNGELIYIEV